MVTISASTARQTLPAQLDRVARGEEVAITRHGRVVAVLVSPEVLRARRAPQMWERAEDLAARLGSLRVDPAPPVEIEPNRVDELIAEAQHSRSRGR